MILVSLTKKTSKEKHPWGWARSTTKSNKIKPFSVSLKSKFLLTKYGSSYRLS
jgi:hypothetical protein